MSASSPCAYVHRRLHVVSATRMSSSSDPSEFPSTFAPSFGGTTARFSPLGEIHPSDLRSCSFNHPSRSTLQSQSDAKVSRLGPNSSISQPTSVVSLAELGQILENIGRHPPNMAPRWPTRPELAESRPTLGSWSNFWTNVVPLLGNLCAAYGGITWGHFSGRMANNCSAIAGYLSLCHRRPLQGRWQHMRQYPRCARLQDFAKPAVPSRTCHARPRPRW